MKRPVTIAHVITGLEAHGAERFLLRLAQHLPSQFHSHIISLSENGPVGFELERMGFPVEALGMARGPSALLRMAPLVGRLAAIKPDIVQTWMYRGDLFGGVAARLAGVRRVAWGIRHGNFRRCESLATLAVARACALLSPIVPDVIVSNSRTAQDDHVSRGYARNKFVVIPNGFELDRFKPDDEARARIRAALGIAEASIAVGVVGRFHPQKGHAVFFRAAGGLVRRGLNVVFVLAGDGVDEANEAIAGWIEAEGLHGRVRLMGPQSDVARTVYPALDILALPSLGEGFPNVLGEAMACGVPAVVTDVGDSALIVGETGVVVPSYDSDRLEAGLLEMATLSQEQRQALGQAARDRVVENFEIGAVVASYVRFYEALLENPDHAVRGLGLSRA